MQITSGGAAISRQLSKQYHSFQFPALPCHLNMYFLRNAGSRYLTRSSLSLCVRTVTIKNRLIFKSSWIHYPPYFSKGPSDMKQKCTQLPPPFSGTVLYTLSLGVILFVQSNSFAKDQNAPIMFIFLTKRLFYFLWVELWVEAKKACIDIERYAGRNWDGRFGGRGKCNE